MVRTQTATARTEKSRTIRCNCARDAIRKVPCGLAFVTDQGGQLTY